MITEMQPKSPPPLPEQALFDGHIQGLVATFFQNERPPRGLAGRLDWYLQGAISKQLQNGFISGKLNECVYLPIKRRQSTYHVLLIGCGEALSPDHRIPLGRDSLQILKKNLASLRWKLTGISRSDFGNPTESSLKISLEGVNLWIGT